MYVCTCNFQIIFCYSLIDLTKCNDLITKQVTFGLMKLICNFLLFLLLTALNSIAQPLKTRFERTNGIETVTYNECISYYKNLDTQFNTISMNEIGKTDGSKPLHAVFFCKDKNYFNSKNSKQKKLHILINNAIHPGEPDGVDASMMLLRDIAMGKLPISDQIVLVVIPIYNVGGALNRNAYSRANQNGPVEYGFRGNGQNLDLNRDFIKMDAQETQSLIQLFHEIDPEIFIDNHVSNGADYQHVMTLLTVQPKKLGYYTGKYLQNKMEPDIYKAMKSKGYDLVPYVNHWGNTPDSGWAQFYEPPRFASGFASLFQTISFVPETHMLKPYQQRVWSTYALMETIINYASQYTSEIQEVRKMERLAIQEKAAFTLDWKVDTMFSLINFKGYEAAYKPSLISGQDRLYYDRSKPYEKQVKFYNKFMPSMTANAPKYYVISSAWYKVINILKRNKVELIALKKDTVIAVKKYIINNYETTSKPFEGHYVHSKLSYSEVLDSILFHGGDFLIPLQQKAKRYLMETLEPQAPDAFFAWGFFDPILQQKEGYSDYVFEDEAASILEKDSLLKAEFLKKKSEDEAFQKNGQAQLDYIYKHSKHYEKVHMRYPVFRIE